MRVKWGAGEEKCCALSTDVEAFKGSTWLWDHFKRFTKEDSYLQQQNYEASCNICKEEAKSDPTIPWVVFYDKSTTKLERHLAKCHPSIVKE